MKQFVIEVWIKSIGDRGTGGCMMNLSRDELWFWLCNIKGIGNKKITDLLEYYGELEYIFNAKEEELSQIRSLNNKDIVYLAKKHEQEKIKAVYANLKNQNVRFLNREMEEYPRRLLEIYDPPYGIFVKGKLLETTTTAIAIIGARKCTNYGRQVAEYFARELARAGVAIISGMAMGIDGYSQQSALDATGYSLGILGCGINNCYPATNHVLYEQLAKQGGLMSEYGGSASPKPGNFPRRNRLISAMSDGILVVEAREKSGTLITVDQGLEQGKDIFVIPGRITDPLSVGCNRLMAMGANVVCHPKELLEYYHMSTKEREKKAITLTSEERLIYSCLSEVPQSINTIADKIDLSIGELMEYMLRLELCDLVVEVTKNCFAKSKLEISS